MPAKRLPEPVLFYDKGSRHWWRFGDGEQAVTVTEGPCSHGRSFACHADPATHDCAHILALEDHLGIRDFRNAPRQRSTAAERVA